MDEYNFGVKVTVAQFFGVQNIDDFLKPSEKFFRKYGLTEAEKQNEIFRLLQYLR